MRSIHIGGIAKWLRRRSAKLLIAGSNPATIFIGLIAQLAEQRFEDPRVNGSIPSIRFCNLTESTPFKLMY